MTQAEVSLSQRKAIGRLLERREAPAGGCALLGGAAEKGGAPDVFALPDHVAPKEVGVVHLRVCPLPNM